MKKMTVSVAVVVDDRDVATALEAAKALRCACVHEPLYSGITTLRYQFAYRATENTPRVVNESRGRVHASLLVRGVRFTDLNDDPGQRESEVSSPPPPTGGEESLTVGAGECEPSEIERIRNEHGSLIGNKLNYL